MFLEIAIGSIGIGIVLMIGFLLIAQVRNALPTPQSTYPNSCYGHGLNDTTYCNTTSVTCGPLTDNTSLYVTCDNTAFGPGVSGLETSVYAGFGLIAVGIIVLAAFGIINIFK